MRSPSYDLNDEDYDRFILGDPGSLDPVPLIILVIAVVGVALWWFQ